MKKVIIDTDPGTDDALALIAGLNSPELDIQGLTTVAGNASLANTTRNALCILEYLGQPHMPVSRGAARPMRGKFSYAYYFHGPRGLTARLPSPKTEPVALRAPDYIIGLAHSLPGEIALIALGPLTNVARALQKEPQLKDWLKEIVVMGGAVEVEGNVTPYAEFNIYDDPLAANVVFSSGAPVTLIGLDVCRHTYFTKEDIALFSGESKSQTLARKILSGWFATRNQTEHYHLCDPLAVAATIKPELLSYRQASVTVVEDGERMGQTVATYDNGNVKVALNVNPAEAKQFIISLIKA
ncbi:MAG: nucleoside hydrolase [Chloroflexi bacterium]|nr:nucleoside hydrolase [Chloroflexota bacterium]